MGTDIIGEPYDFCPLGPIRKQLSFTITLKKFAKTLPSYAKRGTERDYFDIDLEKGKMMMGGKN
jgi:hypothetical protein